MAKQLSGKTMRLRISTNVTTPDLKTVVCRDGVDLDISTNVNRRSTACGSFATTGAPEGSISFSGVASVDPATGEFGHKDALAAAIAGVPVIAELSDADTANLFLSSEAVVSSFSLSAPHDDVVEFNFTLELTGTLDITP